MYKLFHFNKCGFTDKFSLNAGQHVALHDPNPLPNCVGYIHTKMSPLEVARDASEDARSMCLREYGSAPAVNIYGDPNLTFPYVFFLNHDHIIRYTKRCSVRSYISLFYVFLSAVMFHLICI